MNRRAFLAGLVAGAGGLLVPAGLIVPESRRYWQLGRWREPAPAMTTADAFIPEVWARLAMVAGEMPPFPWPELTPPAIGIGVTWIVQ